MSIEAVVNFRSKYIEMYTAIRTHIVIVCLAHDIDLGNRPGHIADINLGGTSF
jgi:hypothetical protein